MTAVEIFSIVKDIIIGGAAATTALVAYKGLERWQKELRGRANFETARELVRSTYNLRDKLEVARSPYIPGQEFPEGYNPMSDNSPEIEGGAYAHIYGRRWEPVSDAVQAFDTSVLEAESLWGAEIRSKADALRDCVRELQVAIDSIIEDKYSGGENFKDREFARKTRSKVSGVKKDKNQLSQQINLAIENIENKIGPYLDRS